MKKVSTPKHNKRRQTSFKRKNVIALIQIAKRGSLGSACAIHQLGTRGIRRADWNKILTG